MGQPRSTTIKGGGGEAQRNPLKKCRAITLIGQDIVEEVWPDMGLTERYDWRGESLDAALPAKLWRGDVQMSAPEAAVIASTALALRTLGGVKNITEADETARGWWQNRDRTI